MKLCSTDAFVFDGYTTNWHKGEIKFVYKAETSHGLYEFKEFLYTEPINFDSLSRDSQHGLKLIIDNLSILLGISYWKLFCPPNLRLPYIKINEEQAVFWNTIYTHALGEFFYKNSIDYRGLIRFPYKTETEHHLGGFAPNDKSLLLMGGGKDSIVSGELMKKHAKDFDLFSVGAYPVIKNVSAQMDKKLLWEKES